MSNTEYNDVLTQVLQLSPEEQLRLLAELASMLGYQLRSQRLHDVMEFKGVGKEVWAGVDVDKYIEEERNSWER